MRRLACFAPALLGLLAFVAVATAGEVGPSPGGLVQGLEVKHSSSKAKRPTTVTVTVNLRHTDPNVTPSLTTQANVHLPRGTKLGYRHFPTCDHRKLVQPIDESKPPTGCPRKSRVGKGKGIADARPLLGAGSAPVEAPVFAFNGRRQGGRPTYILWANSPIDPDITLVGVLRGRVLEITIPQGNPLCGGATGNPNICAGITHFSVKTGAKIRKKVRVRRRGKRRTIRRTYHYLQNPRRCSRSAGYRWKIDFSYKNGDTLSPTDKVRCRR